MCVLLILFVLGLGAVASAGAPGPKALNPFKIVGGNETTIEHYPFLAKIIYTDDLITFYPGCEAIIINNMTVFTAADCIRRFAYIQLRVQVGTSFLYSGGVDHKVKKYVILYQTPDFFDFGTNLAIVHLASPIAFNERAQPATLAEADYQLGDNEMVWTAGWGRGRRQGLRSKQLRHVQTFTVNQAECKKRYGYYDVNITEVLLCASWLDVGHHGICGDQGGPLVHNGVVVGVNAWTFDFICGTKYFPDLFARISTARKWIDDNA